MRSLAVCLLLAGCARAGPENRIIGGLADAALPDTSRSDAGLPDAAPRAVTLSQTTSDDVMAKNSLGCTAAIGGVTRAISYYRVFALAEHAITTKLHVASVTFGIETALAGGGAGAQPAKLRIGSYRGALGGTTLDLTQIQPISSVDVTIRDASATAMTVAISGDLSPGTNLIAELAIPDGAAQGNQFVLGSNASGERRTGYLFAPRCGFSPPTSLKSIASAQSRGPIDLVFTVSGFTDTAAP